MSELTLLLRFGPMLERPLPRQGQTMILFIPGMTKQFQQQQSGMQQFQTTIPRQVGGVIEERYTTAMLLLLLLLVLATLRLSFNEWRPVMRRLNEWRPMMRH